MANNYENIFDPNIISQLHASDPTKKVTDIIYDCLESAILSSEIKPGDKLNASSIAEALGVSITPVRNAIKQLASVGLLSESENGKSFFAFNISEKMLTEIFDTRWTLEGSAAYICAHRLALIDMGELRRLAELHRTLWLQFSNGDNSSSNRRQRVDADRSFHKLLIRYTNNQFLIDYYSTLDKLATHALVRAIEFWDCEKERNNILVLSQQHHVICNAIESGVPEVARQASEAHVKFATLRCAVNRKTLL